MKKFSLVLAFAISSVSAHTALMSCFDNADNTITCEGGFSDGSSAYGVKFNIKQNGKIILEDKFNEDSEVTFEKPQGEYEVTFDGGEGHSVVLKSSDIAE